MTSDLNIVSIVDELYDLKQQMAELEARSKSLKELLVNTGEKEFMGTKAKVVISYRDEKSINPYSLYGHLQTKNRVQDFPMYVKVSMTEAKKLLSKEDFDRLVEIKAGTTPVVTVK
jgi:hypothetical protein